MQIKPIILALINKRPIIYLTMILSIGAMATYSVLNGVIERKYQIKENDTKKQNFLSGKLLELKPFIDKEIKLKAELDTLKQEIKPINDCINGVKATLGTLERYDCNKKTGFIQKASAEEVNSEIPKIQSNWLVNKQGLSKSKQELHGNTFNEISLAHGIPIEYWYNSEKKWKVKKEVGLCIAWADSGLGKYLKTKNNIGNVGNNDRGDRVHISTLEKGVDVIFQTLNNKYLKHKQSIGSLSVGGGGSKPYYATSPDNWNVNVKNCLGVIHGVAISENFKIRL